MEWNFFFTVPVMVPCPLPFRKTRHPMRTCGFLLDSCISHAGVRVCGDLGSNVSWDEDEEGEDEEDESVLNRRLATRDILLLDDAVVESWLLPGLVLVLVVLVRVEGEAPWACREALRGAAESRDVTDRSLLRGLPLTQEEPLAYNSLTQRIENWVKRD